MDKINQILDWVNTNRWARTINVVAGFLTIGLAARLYWSNYAGSYWNTLYDQSLRILNATINVEIIATAANVLAVIAGVNVILLALLAARGAIRGRLVRPIRRIEIEQIEALSGTTRLDLSEEARDILCVASAGEGIYEGRVTLEPSYYICTVGGLQMAQGHRSFNAYLSAVKELRINGLIDAPITTGAFNQKIELHLSYPAGYQKADEICAENNSSASQVDSLSETAKQVLSAAAEGVGSTQGLVTLYQTNARCAAGGLSLSSTGDNRQKSYAEYKASVLELEAKGLIGLTKGDLINAPTAEFRLTRSGYELASGLSTTY